MYNFSRLFYGWNDLNEEFAVLRYLIVVGHSAGTPDCDVVAEVQQRLPKTRRVWETALRKPGIYVGIVTNDFDPLPPILLNNDCGIILGSLYSREYRPGTSGPHGLLQLAESESNFSSELISGR